MAFLKIGEKDQDGRQKRIEHTGPYLRASRTGGLSLRAQTRVAGVNLTGNTRHGLRVSTRLAKNTQVAFQNGRFVLRGRYGSDAAKLNLSKSGITVSSKTPIGTLNWVRPARSSAKIAGLQFRGQNALTIHAIYAVFAIFAGILRVLGGLLRGLGGLFTGVGRWMAANRARRELAEEEAARPRFDLEAVRSQGERILATQEAALAQWPARDHLAALGYGLLVLGRGHTRWSLSRGLEETRSAAETALLMDLDAAAEHWEHWLSRQPPDPYEAVIGIMVMLAQALTQSPQLITHPELRGEILLALDDACLRDGPKTLLQEAMLDLIAEAMAVEVVLEGEA